MDWYLDTQNLGTDHELIEVRSGPSAIPGRRYHRFEHRFRGVPVVGDALNLQTSNGVVIRSWERVRSDLPTLDPVDPPTLLAAAKAAFEAALLPSPTVDYHPTAPHHCSSVILADLPDPVFAYQCILRSVTPHADFRVAVRVDDGSLVFARSLESQAWFPVAIEADTWLHGRVGPFHAEQESDPDYECRLRAHDAETFDGYGYDLDRLIEMQLAEIDLISEASCQFQSPDAVDGVTVHWGVQASLATYESIFSDRPLEAFLADGILESYVNLDYDNATYSTLDQILLFGHHPQSLAELSVVGHEVGHALAHARLGDAYLLTSFFDYEAMVEGWADYLGILTEAAELEATDWQIHFIRNLLDPLGEGRPDVYQGLHWSGVDEHVNSSVLTRWLSLLARGGSGTNSNGNPYSVASLEAGDWETSMALPARVLAAAMFELLAVSATYPELRQATQLGASDLCGDLSLLSKSVHEAWFAVGLESTVWPSVVTSPPDQGVDVPPWPVRFTWPVDPTGPLPGVDWTLELAADLAFDPSAFHPVPATSIEDVGGVDHHVFELPLAPGKSYAWRVRPLLPQPYRCWRPMQTFQTAANIPTAISPSQGAYHPWKLPFEVGVPPGTELIEIQVGYAPDLENQPIEDLVFPPKVFPATADDRHSSQSFELTVPKARNRLYWRVRAHRDGYSSDWSAERSFDTTDPIVEPIGPQGLTYPWLIAFDWHRLRGGERYEGEIDETTGVFPGANLSLTEPYPHPIIRSYPAAKGTAEFLEWWVHAIGPRFGSEAQPEAEATRELSRPSPTLQFSLDKPATQAEPNQPIYDPSLRNCHPVAEPLRVGHWAVPEMIDTEVKIYWRLGDSFTPSPDLLVYEAIVDTPPLAFDVTAPAAIHPGFPAPGLVRRQFQVEVRALGPGYYGGTTTPTDYTSGWPPDHPTNLGRYFLEPTIPTPVDPATVAVDWGQDTLRMAWATDLVTAGHFVLEVYDGPGCAGTATTEGVPTSSWHGLNSVERSGAPGATYSWRVRPGDDPKCAAASSQWSECTDFTIVGPPPPTSVACDVQIHEGSNSPESHTIDLGQNAGVTHLRLDTFNVPDQMRVVYENQEIFDTGCYGTSQLAQGCSGPCCCDGSGVCWCEIPYSGGSTQMRVDVEPNCDGTPDTQWWFTLECP